jgi:hypothetical protein
LAVILATARMPMTGRRAEQALVEDEIPFPAVAQMVGLLRKVKNALSFNED